MMDIKAVLLKWFIHVLIRIFLLRVQVNLLAVLLKIKISQTKN